MAMKWNKPVVRETGVAVAYDGKYRALNVSLDDDKIVLWPKGTRQKVEVTINELYGAIVSNSLNRKPVKNEDEDSDSSDSESEAELDSEWSVDDDED